jgi:hypothetical protein
MHTIPIAVKIFIVVGLLGAGGLLIGVPLVGLRLDIRYERARLRNLYSARNRRIFWGWAIAFPVTILVGSLLGVLVHAGKDWFLSDLIGGGIAAAVVIPSSWIVLFFLSRRPAEPVDVSSGTTDPGHPT